MKTTPALVVERVGEIWKRLISPLETITDPNKRRLSTLLSSSLIVVIMILILLTLVQNIMGVSMWREDVIRGSVAACSLIAYWLSRRGRVQFASTMIMMLGATLIYLNVLLGPLRNDLQSLYYLAALTLLGSLFLSLRFTLLVILAEFMGLFVLQWLAADITLQDMVNGPVSILMTLAALTILVTYHRDWLQSSRQESDGRYEQLVSILPDGVVVHSDGKIIFANSAAAKIVGADSPRKLIEQPVLSFVHPDYREMVKERIHGVVNTGEPSPLMEERFVRLDETSVDVEVTAISFLGKREPAVLVVFRDITERKRTQIAQRESEERLKQAAQIARLGIWDWEIESDQTEWYGEMFDIYGVKPEDFTAKGVDYIEFTRADYKEAQFKNIERAFQNGITEEQLREGTELPRDPQELCIVRPDGTEAYTLGDAIVIIDDDGTPTRMLGATLDITDLRQAEEALRMSERTLRGFMETSTDAIRLVDEDGIVIEWNAANEQLDGITQADAVGQYYWDLMREFVDESTLMQNTGLDFEAFEREMKQFLRSGNLPEWLRVEEYTARSTRQTINATNFLIETEKGYRFASILRNITARKQAEEQIKRTLHDKEVLLQEVHHRVNNNLQTIASLLNLQANAITDPAVIHALKDSRSRVHSMALVHEKLYGSSNLAYIDFAEYVQGLVNHLTQTYGEQAQRVKMNTHLANFTLDIDAAIPCGLIVNELVSNALKHGFINGDSGNIDITTTHDGTMIELRVRDDGIGIPDSLKIEELSSLGLKLVYNLTRQLKGTVELDQIDGTAFVVRFARPKSVLELYS